LNIKETIYKWLQYEATPDQEKLIHALEKFTLSTKSNPILIINGHAGTGKTSLISAYVKSLSTLKIRSQLMAPTGRAAKVFSSFAKKKASTIHKFIYRHSADEGGYSSWKRQENKNSNTVFIIDEASMISSQTAVSGSGFTYRTLLEDVVDFVFEQKGNKLILIGDLAQLPPVGEKESLALTTSYFSTIGNFPIALISLKEVVRQDAGSLVLNNATIVRNMIDASHPGFPSFILENPNEVMAINGHELQEYLESSYDEVGMDSMIFITWSNKRANIFNQQIRSRILWHEEEINAGDYIMVVKNNYFWIEDNFIANGDVLVVSRVQKIIERYDMKFAELSVYFMDDDDKNTFDVIVLLDVLTEEGPSLSAEKAKILFGKIEEDYIDIKSHAKRIKKVFDDPFYNALQIKFAYAVTAHKSQGGQWPIVFLEQPFIREALPTVEDLRWLYTGITRSSSKLYFVNFSEQFFKNSE
jgi:exodeoxyribonuclease-5